MTDKLTTAQKAEAWFHEIGKFIQPTATEIEASKIITALLKENRAFRSTLERIADPRNIHFKGDAQYVAQQAIAKREEQNNE